MLGRLWLGMHSGKKGCIPRLGGELHFVLSLSCSFSRRTGEGFAVAAGGVHTDDGSQRNAAATNAVVRSVLFAQPSSQDPGGRKHRPGSAARGQVGDGDEGAAWCPEGPGDPEPSPLSSSVLPRGTVPKAKVSVDLPDGRFATSPSLLVCLTAADSRWLCSLLCPQVTCIFYCDCQSGKLESIVLVTGPTLAEKSTYSSIQEGFILSLGDS